MDFIGIAMVVLVAIIVISKGLLIYRNSASSTKRKISEEYITTLTNAIVEEASNQTFSILIAIKAVKTGAVNNVTMRKNNTRIEKDPYGKVRVKIERKRLILTSQDVKDQVVKELRGGLPGVNLEFINLVVLKALGNSGSMAAGHLLVLLSSTLDENTIIEEI